MPLSISLNRNGVTVPAYPALVDLKDYCGLRLFPTDKLASEEHRRGILRLFVITQHKRLANQIKYFPRLQEFELYGKVHQAFKDFRLQLLDFLVEQTFSKVTDWPRNAQHFDQLVEQGLNNLNSTISLTAPVIAKIYDGLLSAKKAIKNLQSPNQLSTRQDLELQLDRLLPATFLTAISYNWLTQFPRYLQGIELRCRKLTAAGLEADRKRQTELAPFWNIYMQVEPRYAKLPTLPAPLLTYRYMLEEFRVSLFAQELGTSITISPKRLEKQWETVRKELS
jgi:ATP-dependent helicase HrpA